MCIRDRNSHITDETVMHTDAKTSYSLTLAKTTRIEKEGKLAKLKEQLDNAKNKRRQLILRQPLNDLLKMCIRDRLLSGLFSQQEHQNLKRAHLLHLKYSQAM